MLVPRETPLFTQEQIAQRVEEMGEAIAREMCQEGPITVLGLLRGCYVFTADLLRAISRHGGKVEELDFLIASSYGDGTESSGNVKIERDARSDIAGRRVLVVDDILDTGHTLARVAALLEDRGPELLRIAVLLDKPSRRQANVYADYVGYEIDNLFVVGYGLDFDQDYRELPYITVVEEQDE